MKRLFILVCLVSQIPSLGQSVVFEPDTTIKRIIRTTGYPNQQLQDSAVSSIVFAIVYHSKNGHIDSIVTSTETIFAKHIKAKLALTDGHWKNKKGTFTTPVVIPFLFTTVEEKQRDIITIDYQAEINPLYRWLKQGPFPCLFFPPVLYYGQAQQSRK